MLLLFLGEKADLERLKPHLDDYAGWGWNARGNILLVELKDRKNAHDVRARLKRAIPPGTYHVCLLRHDTEYSDLRLRAPDSVHRPPSTHNLDASLKDGLVRKVLQIIGVDWR